MPPLSPSEMAGQRLMLGFDGLVLTDDLKSVMERLKPGGLILFKQNISSPDQIADLCTSTQSHASALGLPPLLIAIDQEGGQVARLPPPFTRFPGNPAMKGLEDADEFAEITARELKRVGINMNMAPVLDVAPEGINSIMAGRSFGGDPAWVAQMGGRVIAGLQEWGIMAVAKHFPGIGRTILDSHLALPTLDVDRKSILSLEIPPFRTAIACGVSGIMMSHIRYPAFDSEWPAGMSASLTGFLRKDLGYDGVIMTDDLDMGAVGEHFDFKTAVRQVLEAQVDMLLVCHRSSRQEEAFEEILQAAVNSLEGEAKAHRSVTRILDLKRKYCCL